MLRNCREKQLSQEPIFRIFQTEDLSQRDCVYLYIHFDFVYFEKKNVITINREIKVEYYQYCMTLTLHLIKNKFVVFISFDNKLYFFVQHFQKNLNRLFIIIFDRARS